MHTAAAIKSAPDYHTARKMIEANMSAAFLSGADAVVYVTARADGKWTVSGDPAHVARAEKVATLAGLVLESVEYDEELDESFAYYRER